MFRHIVVPLDGSPVAERILPEVRELVRLHGAEVTLLRVAYAHVLPGTDPTEVQVKATEEATEYLNKVREEFEKEGVSVDAVVRYGHPAEEILAHASREGIDMIAMSTHGRTGPARWLLGSVAEQVLRYAQVPILLIRVPRVPE